MHLAQPSRWLADHHDFCHAAALVFTVLAPWPPWCPCNRLAYLSQQLKRTLIKTDHGVLLIERAGVNFYHVLHAGYKLFIDLWDAPLLLLPRLEFAFFKS